MNKQKCPYPYGYGHLLYQKGKNMFKNDTLFSRFMNVLCDVLCVGILWFVCSIPLFTIGAAATAAYYAMAKSVRFKTGYAWREFLHSFRSNFGQTVPLSIILLLIMAVLFLDVFYIWSQEGQMYSALFMVLVLVIFIVAGALMYLFPLLSRFDKRNVEILKMACVVMFRYLPVTIMMLLVFFAGCVGIYLMPWAILVIPGIWLYLFTFPMEWIMRKLMPKPEEGSEEAEKWYYQ